MTTSNERSQIMTDLLKKSNINVRRVTCLGAFVHVDSFEKYGARIRGIFAAMGAVSIRESNGRHMDSVDGYRIVAQF